MLPILAAIAHLVKFGNSDSVLVSRGVFRFDVHCNLSEIHIRAYAGRSGDAGVLEDFAYHPHCQFVRAAIIAAQVVCDIHKHLVDGIDVNVISRNELQVSRIDLRAHLHIFSHTGRSDNVIQGNGGIALHLIIVINPLNEFSAILPAPLGIDIPDSLDDLEQAGSSGDAVGFERRGDRKAYGLFRSRHIGDNKIGRQRVEPPGGTFNRSIEGFEVDGYVCSGIAHCMAR